MDFQRSFDINASGVKVKVTVNVGVTVQVNCCDCASTVKTSSSQEVPRPLLAIANEPHFKVTLDTEVPDDDDDEEEEQSGLLSQLLSSQEQSGNESEKEVTEDQFVENGMRVDSQSTQDLHTPSRFLKPVFPSPSSPDLHGCGVWSPATNARMCLQKRQRLNPSPGSGSPRTPVSQKRLRPTTPVGSAPWTPVGSAAWTPESKQAVPEPTKAVANWDAWPDSCP